MGWQIMQTGLVVATNATPNVPVVYACIPHWGKIEMAFAQTTLAPLLNVPSPYFSKNTFLSRGILNLDTARNDLVRLALEDGKATHIMFIDSDTIPKYPPNINDAIYMLLQMNAPVASGWYTALQRDGFHNAMWVKNEYGSYTTVPTGAWSPPTATWIKVNAIGMGFCLFKREVFEKIPPPWFVWDKPYPSEDFAFCQKLEAAGYDIRVLTCVRLGHIKTIVITPDDNPSNKNPIIEPLPV
jgi:hypothetical protein